MITIVPTHTHIHTHTYTHSHAHAHAERFNIGSRVSKRDPSNVIKNRTSVFVSDTGQTTAVLFRKTGDGRPIRATPCRIIGQGNRHCQ